MHRVRVNDIELHYERRGEGAALVLLHGLGTGSADWDFVMPALAQRYRVIAPCQRGFGESDRPRGPYSIPVLADDVRGLLDALGIERCHLCGVSMGGAVALQFAVDHPARLDSLIVINSQPSFVIDSWKKRLMYLSRLWLAHTIGLRRLARVQARHNFPGPGFAALRKQLDGRFHNTRGPYIGTLRALAGWQVVGKLGRVTAPVLMIASEFDFTPPEEKARFAALFPDARVEVVAGARHAVHVERPDAVSSLMLRFLAQVERRRPEPAAPASAG